ncbi:MAG: cellobiose phosphorylase [Clostridiales bacterium]|nr:cellobiose phosphorylase [Clostridiales bacterium]
MGNYRLEGNTYIMEGFDTLPAFSSFLPGLAGIKGIPIWVYYTNRGQGINSFGIHNKNHAIMEFYPANTAYENTAIKGFRTFIKCNGQYFEPFFTLDQAAERNLYIRRNSFEIEEVNNRHGLKLRIKYTVLPEESIGALVRKVTIENLSSEEKQIELIDGLPKIIPYGITNSAFKEMSNLLKSWTEIKNMDQNAPYYTTRSSSDDSSEVSEIEGGYFYLTIQEQTLLPVIYDPEVIFDYDTSLINPICFMKEPIIKLMNQEQCYYNKVPCAFTPQAFKLTAEQVHQFHTLIGFAGSPEQMNEKLEVFCEKDYFNRKEIRAEEIVDQLTKDVKTQTSMPVFDQYIEQCYLDNFLRGGYPYVFNKKSNRAVVHLFSRKHGDPERDYNFFSIAGEYYSQGNGNFRDVNQNRRNDVFFHKDIGDFNIKTFFNLIQIDGYNPLEVRPSTFSIKPSKKEEAMKLLKDNIVGSAQTLYKIIQGSFTPGQIANCIAKNRIYVACGEDAFLIRLLEYCDENVEAGFGEGYWSDHWNYNMDLIEGYLRIYPDKIKELLFLDHSYRFYDSPVRVLPRSDKYVINNKNEVRQYGSIEEDKEKLAREGFKQKGTNWLRTKDGSMVTTTLMGKMISLALNKFATLDSYGMGIEMEGGKPGWNDAMNGLPGLFGSGMAETFELKRLITFLCNTIRIEDELLLPVEIYHFLTKVAEALHNFYEKSWDDFTYWDTVASLRESFREQVRFGLDGELVATSTHFLYQLFCDFNKKIEEGIERANQYGDGIIPTYFTFRAVQFEPVRDEFGEPIISNYGLPKAKVKAFEAIPLPAFLEGPAKRMATLEDRDSAKNLHHKVKNSELYDRKLQMYKTSVPIEHISMEHGRIRAFTPGWLERESIFLHMEYKYLLSLLNAGLYDEFYEELPSSLVAFRNPRQYGRSILENSSFLVSSVNPNLALHGRGYVARLSGSTAEVISMWIRMFVGETIFTYEDGQLYLHLEPKLPGWLFDSNGNVSFQFMSHCKVTYHNRKRMNTYGKDAVRIIRIKIMDTKQEIVGNQIRGELAEKIRNGEVQEIIAYFE